jgi:hypothetical protein
MKVGSHQIWDEHLGDRKTPEIHRFYPMDSPVTLATLYPLVNVYSLRTGKSPSLMGKSTINIYKYAIFNSYFSKLPEGTY